MRKLYILHEEEEDEAILDALEAQGLPLDECQLSNPDCPRCGKPTMLAYQDGEDYEVMTWSGIVDDEGADADAWYLICSEFTCEWHEEVERLVHPRGAEIFFDMHESSMEFDEYAGIFSRRPDHMMELVHWLEQACEGDHHWKLDSILAEAQWRYEESMEQIRRWLKRVPFNRNIEITLDGEQIKGKFLAATDEGLLVQRHKTGEILAVRAECLDYYGPRRFHEPDREPDDAPLNLKNMIMFMFSPDRVIIRGHHVELRHVDRLGQYHVCCRDGRVARALGLKKKAKNFWEGVFRRSQVEGRYEVEPMVKVEGHWVRVWGKANRNGHPAVYTDDEAVAMQLGLPPQRPWFYPDDDDENPEPPKITRWSGVIDPERIEEQKDVKVYIWPIPELAASDSSD